MVCPAGRREVVYYRRHNGPPPDPILRRFSPGDARVLRLGFIADAALKLRDILPPAKV